MALDPSGSVCASASSDKTIRLFDWLSGDAMESVYGQCETITGLAFTADCQNLLSVSADGTVRRLL